MEDIKKEKISLSDLYPAIKTALDSNGEFLLYPDGKSMLPTIRPGSDGVLLCRADSPTRGDLLLYRRLDGSFVLHRLVKIKRDGALVMRGDNQYTDEYGITTEAIVAKVSAVVRGEKKISTASLSFRMDSSLRLFFYPLKRFFHRAKGKIKRSLRRKR